ncbi:MAG TPA: DinB family protein [Vicinamibacterales bacterium]|nr:DinB family protein [Vicinamibacterales bacterium]
MKRAVGVLMMAAVAAMWLAAPAAQTRAGAAQPVSDAVRGSWASAKKNIRDTADVVPEASYSYSPVPGTVRTLGQIIGHVAGANYVFCSAAKGEKSPQAEGAFESLATKAALVKAWDDSVKYCDTAFAALTDKSAADQIELPFGQGKGARTSALLGNIGHLNEHYGNLVTYMRMKGIVPPTSRR